MIAYEVAYQCNDDDNGLQSSLSTTTTMNQHPLVQHEGWMISGHETIFHWIFNPLANHGD